MKKLTFLMMVIWMGLSLQAQHNVSSEDSSHDSLKVYYLDQVVVTSTTKETNKLTNLPTAVSVLSPRQLSNAQVASLPDLSAKIPNFFIPSYGSRVSTPIYIRGLGARLGAQTVSMYVDNVPSFNPSSFDFEFQDIQRVEVLRGAQGTLYGRNAIGGIVNVYTLSPLSYQGTNASVSAGSYGHMAVSAGTYQKVGDNFGVSLNGVYKKDDGYFLNSFTGKNADAMQNAAVRLKLEWQVNPRLHTLLFAHYDNLSQGAFPYMNIDSTNVSYNEQSEYKRQLLTSGFSLRYRGEGYSFNSTTGYQFLKDDMTMDQDYTSREIFDMRQQQKQHSVSQEFTLKSEHYRNYQWVVGAFGFYDHRIIDTPVNLKKDAIAGMQRSFDKISEANPRMPVKLAYNTQLIALPGVYTKPSVGGALFHQSTLNNLFGVDGLSATAGLRLDYEKVSIDYFTESKGADINLTMMNRPMPVNGDTLLQGKLSKDFFQVLPKFALKYQPSKTAFAYLSASKGYKTGGYNEQAFSDILQGGLEQSLMRNTFNMVPAAMRERVIGMMPPRVQQMLEGNALSVEDQLYYQPETSWTFELGGKCEMFDRRLAATFAFFYSNVNNIQIIKLLEEGTAGRIVTNAGKSNSKGFELGLRYNPTNNFTLYSEYGFADARFNNYQMGDVDYTGNHIPFAPQHTLGLGATYVYNFAQGAFLDRLTAGINYSGAGRIYWNEANSAYQNFYGLTNASLSVEKGIFGLELWGKNIFDTSYNSFYFTQSDMVSGGTHEYVQRGYPVRLGATFRVNLLR